MIACLRSARFMPPDRSRSMFVELRRHHDTRAKCDNKQFIVTTRIPAFGPMAGTMIRKAHGTYQEAVKHWDETVRRYEDQGMVRDEMRIVGFREEG